MPGSEHTRVALEVRDLSKSFAGVQALQQASLRVRAGEIHGLLGQNGSGKSTLIKILSGYHSPDPGGSVLVGGREIRLPIGPGEARRHGIAFVHQDLGLVETLTVLDNLRVARYGAGGLRRVSWRSERATARAVLRKFDLDVSLDQKVSTLPEVIRASVAIVRAVRDVEEASGDGVLILDEPTVYLPRDSVDHLFVMMRKVAGEGTAILFVSHQLGEVREITDSVTVLRDGRVVGHDRTAELGETELIELILGRELADLYPEQLAGGGSAAVLSTEMLAGDTVRDVSLDLRKGETLGVTGLVGTGFEEIPYLLYGAKRATNGEISLGRTSIRATDASPALSLRHGMALVPANRLRDGIVGTLTTEDNVSMPILESHYRRRRLQLRALRRTIRQLLERFDVRPPDPSRKMATLSGGNQQKAVLAKWLQRRPSVLLLHEPTQGVDVGARGQIFSLLRDATRAGTGVLIASSEHEDLGHLCDRVLVLHEGRIVRELTGEAVTPDRILEECYRVPAAS